MQTRPQYDDDFFADAVINDPYPVYQDLRARGQVVWLSQHNAWAAVGYEAASTILRKPKIFLSGRGLSLNEDVNKILIGSTLNSDGEQHHRQRQVTATAIMPDALEDIAPFIDKAAEQLVAHLTAHDNFDVVRDFACILPVSIVVEMVGLPPEGKDRMLDWADATFNLFEGFNDRSKASFIKLEELREFLAVYGRPEKLEGGGLAKRIFDEAPRHGFSMDEAAQMMRDYINPSLDTTISAAAFMLYYLAQSPDQYRLLCANPDLIPNAVEEIVRLTTPIRALSRYVSTDTEMHGVTMKEGDRVLVVFASGNRDENVFPDPDRFDVTRKTHKHMGFGQGVHMCMGMHLARRELSALLHALTRHVAAITYADDATIAMNNTIRGLSSLTASFVPHKGSS